MITLDDRYVQMATVSLSTLRRHNPDVHVELLVVADSVGVTGAARRLFDRADAVTYVAPAHRDSGYFFDNVCHLGALDANRILYLDADTFVFGSLRALADRHRDADVAGAANHWIWRRGYRLSYAPQMSTPLNGGVVLMSREFCQRWAANAASRHASILADPQKTDLVNWMLSVNSSAYHRCEFVLSEMAWCGEWSVAVLEPEDCRLLRAGWEQQDPIQWTRSTIFHTYTKNWKRCAARLARIVPECAAAEQQVVDVDTLREVDDQSTASVTVESELHSRHPGLGHKMASLLRFYGDLDRQSRGDEGVRRARLTPTEFYDNYFYPNRPMILEGLMDSWRALSRWTFPWLREQFGEHTVEIHGDRLTDDQYERHLSAGRRMVRFADFVSLVEDDNETNDVYLVGRNYLLARPEFRSLFDDIENPDGFLDASTMNSSNVKLWLGPRGTVTPLHHDRGSVLFAQVRGRKQFKLIAPFHLLSVYNDPRTCYSDVLLDGPVDLDRYPLMRDVPMIEATLYPGEFLFIPAAWWHWVRALDASLSLTFKNFMFRGERLAWHYRQ